MASALSAPGGRPAAQNAAAQGGAGARTRRLRRGGAEALLPLRPRGAVGARSPSTSSHRRTCRASAVGGNTAETEGSAALQGQQGAAAVVRLVARRRVEFGEQLAVCGSLAALGEWDLDRAVAMANSGSPDAEDAWSVDIAVPCGALAEFKIVVLRKGAPASWIGASDGGNFVLRARLGREGAAPTSLDHVESPGCAVGVSDLAMLQIPAGAADAAAAADARQSGGLVPHQAPGELARPDQAGEVASGSPASVLPLHVYGLAGAAAASGGTAEITMKHSVTTETVTTMRVTGSAAGGTADGGAVLTPEDAAVPLTSDAALPTPDAAAPMLEAAAPTIEALEAAATRDPKALRAEEGPQLLVSGVVEPSEDDVIEVEASDVSDNREATMMDDALIANAYLDVIAVFDVNFSPTARDLEEGRVESVEVAGSWDDWKGRVALLPQSQGSSWSCTLACPIRTASLKSLFASKKAAGPRVPADDGTDLNPTVFECKFIVNGEHWCHSEVMPLAGSGADNNNAVGRLDVMPAFSPLVAAAAPVVALPAPASNESAGAEPADVHD